MKEEYKILEQNLEVLNKNSEKYKKTMKIHDIGVDTTSFSEFFDNSFNFKEIKSDYLSNLISFSFLKKVGGFYQWPLLCFSNLVENSIIHGKAKNIFIDIKCYENEIYKRLELATKNTNLEEYKKSSPNLESYNGIYTDKKLVLSIGDDGGGISREIFNKILFCFDAKDTSIMSCINNNQNYLNKNINIKSCCLRLGDSVFILSKTKMIKKFCMVLDIDETLTHTLKLPFGDYFLMRPGVKDFLQEMKKYFEIIIFTSSPKSYADNILDQIDIHNEFFNFRLYRRHAIYENGECVKKLNMIGRDLKKIVFVDNLKSNAKYNLDNLYHIKTWHFDVDDNELIKLKDKLKEIVLSGKFDEDITKGIIGI